MNKSGHARVQLVGGFIALTGLLAAAAAHPALGAPIGFLADIVFWPIDGAPGAPGEPLTQLFAAVAGGVMVGWGSMLVALGRGASLAGALLAGGGAWFVVDGAGSVAAGAPLNIVGNLAFLGLVAWAAASSRSVSLPAAEGEPARTG